MRRIAVWIATLTVAVGVQSRVTFDPEISTFDAANGPFDVFLTFRTDKTGTDSFDVTLPKDRPGDYFSDDVTFSSPNWSAPEQVLWGHFDGPDGGIGPRPSYVGLLRLTFRVPVLAVGFRNPGIQPGIDVRLYDSAGTLLAEQRNVASSFIGASSPVPIARVDIQGSSSNPFHITALRFNKAPVPPSDADGDGVVDSVDQCTGTSTGANVNADGCSLAQLVPCEGPKSGGVWKNHGQYVVAFVQNARTFQTDGGLTADQKEGLIAEAALSSCGK